MISFLGPQKIIKYFKLDMIFHYTTQPWKDFGASQDDKVINMLSQSNFNILQFFEFLSLALNFFLCLDIVLTMRNPFYPHDRRMKNYLPMSILIAVFAFSVSLKRVNYDHDEASDSQNMH